MVKSNKYLSFLAIALLLFFAYVSFGIHVMQQTTLWIAVPGSLILAYLAMPQKGMSSYVKYILILYLWIAFTFIFAVDQKIASNHLQRLLGCFIMIYVFGMLSKDYKLVPWLYFVFIVYYLGMLLYANNNILIEGYDYTEDRMDDKVLGANTVAYFTFFTTFIFYIMDICVTKRFLKKLFRILFLLTPILSFGVAILTASRQVFIIQIPLVLLLMYLRYFRKSRIDRKIIFIAASVFVVLFLGARAVNIYSGSSLGQRSEMEVFEDKRIDLMTKAIEVGADHPIVGVGPGNFGNYAYGRSGFSHCTYTELFANSGFPALVIFVSLLYVYLSRQWKRYKKTKDMSFLSFFIFGIMYSIDNLFYVFYSATWLMSFFILVAMHSDNYYKMKYSSVLSVQ